MLMYSYIHFSFQCKAHDKHNLQTAASARVQVCCASRAHKNTNEHCNSSVNLLLNVTWGEGGMLFNNLGNFNPFHFIYQMHLEIYE